MKFYDQYPMMMPYVGREYGHGSAPKILLVGESHYLPDGSTQHLSEDVWYGGNSSTLTDEERDWIDTAGVVKTACDENFSTKSFSIFDNSFWEINENGPRFPTHKSVADHIVFYNFFLRPGLQGDSLEVKKKDVEFANDAFNIHYSKFTPSAIVFLSRLSLWHFRSTIPAHIPVISTPHPGCQWWNRVAKSYGNKRGRDVLADFIKTTTW